MKSFDDKESKNATTEKPKLISWKRSKGSSYFQPLHPDMLTEKGLLVKRTIRFENEKGQPEKQEVLVHYDKNYAMSKLHHELKPLARTINRADIEKLIKRTLDRLEYCEKEIELKEEEKAKRNSKQHKQGLGAAFTVGKPIPDWNHRC